MSLQDSGQTVNDDQALAKVLAGVAPAATDGLVFEETGTTDPSAASPRTIDPTQPPAVVLPDPKTVTLPVAGAANLPSTPMASGVAAPLPPANPPRDESLDSIKLAALSELRPLVDRLTVPAEEKFDIYLLLLRSTDDKSLIAPALEVARTITDEARKAQALLDVVKEIDFLSQN